MKAKSGQLLILFSLLITLGFYLLSKSDLSVVWALPWFTLDQLSALLGSVLFAWSFILASRWAWIETAFGGLDKVYHWHKDIGKLAFCLLLAHPLFLLAAYAPIRNGDVNLLLPGNNLANDLGKVALLIMAAIIWALIYGKLRYDWFIKIQKFFGIALAFGILHLLFVSSDVSGYWPLGWWMILMFAFGLIAYVYRELFYVRLSRRYDYEVVEVENYDDPPSQRYGEASQIIDFYLRPLGRALKHHGGQFAYFMFATKGLDKEPHPFSLASAGATETLRIAVKPAGDWTKLLPQVKIGDKVTVFGAHGHFHEAWQTYRQTVVVAGGIGVTPFLGMLAEEVLKPRLANQTIDFFYAVRNQAEAIFDPELQAIAQKLNGLTYNLCLSAVDGRLTAEKILVGVDDLATTGVFLCGPSAMMQMLAKQLRARGLKKEQIVFEDFNYK